MRRDVREAPQPDHPLEHPELAGGRLQLRAGVVPPADLNHQLPELYPRPRQPPGTDSLGDDHRLADGGLGRVELPEFG